MNLTDTERAQPLSAARSRTVRAANVRRAKLILMLEDGEPRDSIMRTLGCDSRFIARWSGRFLSERLSGMYARRPGRAPKQPPARLEARVLIHLSAVSVIDHDRSLVSFRAREVTTTTNIDVRYMQPA
ncbi:helix-turn-helix domain-containing protein [Caballeronia sp. EK]|uniref:helix-turn-helix domain-containing protein n=1 Tax=Caballeronia sp. EK TaxID=2767469 RepID=UPI002103B6C9|nr:helix-turn-helix domain-containing protein [Caballeronia sp. EK]